MKFVNTDWLLREISRHLEIMVRGDDISDVVTAIRGKDLKQIIDRAPTIEYKIVEVDNENHNK